MTVAIRVEVPPGASASLVGPVTSVHLDPNQNRRVDFFLRLSPPPSAALELALALEENGVILKRQPFRVVPP
jgi:hypothetical protein